jgi:hypothetical protein
MQIFIFQSERDDHDFAFTTDKTGANLPGELGPWHPFPAGTQAATSAEALASTGVLATARAEIESNCYSIVRAGDVKIGRDPLVTRH